MREKQTVNGKISFLEKAERIMTDYNQATGSSVCIYDSNCNQILFENSGKLFPESKICPYCPLCSNFQDELPCREIHINAINTANRKGAATIYQCKAGLIFWISPIYTEGCFSGAIRGSGFLSIDHKIDDNDHIPIDDIDHKFDDKDQKIVDIDQKTVDIFENAIDTHVMCNIEKSKDEFNGRIKSLPKADKEKIQSLSEMMQMCAESLSSGSDDHHEMLKRRAEQQEAIGKILEELKKKYPEDTLEKPGYSLEKEKTLINTLRKGDVAESKKLLNELIALMIFSYPNQFNYVQLRVTELIVLLSRIETGSAKNAMLSMEANCQSLKLVQEAKTFEELTGILHIVTDRLLNIVSSFHGIPHAAALRKAETFIMENYTRKISLKQIAAVAGLSPPYFSTIFKEEMGENLSKYLNRLRVEKASHLLLETDMSLSEIAACCCFEDQSWFSKIFKAYTGISPGKYRNQGGATRIY